MSPEQVTPAQIGAWLNDAPPLNDRVLRLWADYLNLLLKWNARTNLVGFNDPARICRELLADSASLGVFLEKIFPEFNGVVWEPGAGAGIPGIPLRALWQKGSYVLIEPREKRSSFMDNALARLRLPGVSVFRGRLEDYAAPAPDVVISRAFRPWPELIKLFTPRFKGMLIVMANDPPPRDIRTLVAEDSYQASGKTRRLWALTLPAE